MAVTAPAVDGRATDAVLAAVAAAFGLGARQVRLVAGATSRTKSVALDGDPQVLRERLAVLLTGRSPADHPPISGR